MSTPQIPATEARGATATDQIALLGPFPSSFAANKWIVVATDYLTKYAETRALQRATASDVRSFSSNRSFFAIEPRRTFTQQFTQHAEEARQLVRPHITQQMSGDARRFNARHRQVEHHAGDQVWVWTPVRRQGLSEKLLIRYFGPYKVLRRVSDVNYEVVPDGASSPQRRKHASEIVHVVRLKPYYAR